MSKERSKVYEGRVIDVSRESVVLPNGAHCELEIVEHPGGAASVALDAQGRVCLLHQYRHVAGGWLWELPAGKIDAGEDPLVTARRELLEETGCVAEQWLSLGMVNSSPGIFDEIVYLYLARDLSLGTAEREDHEVFEVHWIPFENALDWALAGRINDAKSVIGLFRAAKPIG